MSHLVRVSQNHMNTTFHFIVSTREPRRAKAVLEEAQRRMTVLEHELSEFLPGSPVYQINHVRAFEKIPVTKSFLEVWNLAQTAHQISSGFDSLVKSRAKHSGIQMKSGFAWRTDDETHVSFGAIGKGYAIDEARLLIIQEGFSDYCLNAGGSSLAFAGFKFEGVPWDFAWSWENGQGISLLHSSGDNVCIGVSGLITQQAHLIDPSSKTSCAGCLTSLVGHPSAAMADALSTAVFVRGFDAAIQELSKMTFRPAIAVIENDKRPRWNGLFRHWWGAIAFFLCTVGVADDEVIDFSDLSDFTPYLHDTNAAWILLPLLTLLWVFWHLQQQEKTK